MKVLHLDYRQFPTEANKSLDAGMDVKSLECPDQLALYTELESTHYDAIITRLGLMIDSKAMSLQPSLKFVVTATTGLNHIDINAAQERGIKVVSLKGESEFLADVKSTAEHTWGLLLSLIRNLTGAVDYVRQGGWGRSAFLSDELDGKTLGVVGYGRLGKIVAHYGVAFGMTVFVHDINPESGDVAAGIHRSDLSGLLKKSDIVVLLISWSPANENFMDRSKFSLMKQKSYFINTSRGELVDESALLEALVEGKIAGAALDVLKNDSSWSQVVDGSEHLLAYARANSNLIITPHVGGYGKDSIAKTRNFIANKFISLAKSGK